MRLVQVSIPTGKRDAVLDVLDREGIDFVLTDETSGRGYTGVAYFPVPTGAVESVLGQLRDAGIDEDAYTVVLNAETVTSRKFDEFEERYAEEESEERIAREELKTKARQFAPSLSTYVGMTVISAVIATAGLLLDSPAVVVGSMVIAPLIGPAMAASVGTVVDDPEMFSSGVRLQVLGMSVAIAAAAVFAWVIKTIHFVPPGLDLTAIPEIRERMSPDFLSLAVALGAGAAGVISLSTGVSTALVGVMIAVALIPPAATVGLGIAWGLPALSIGAGVLALVNGLSINLAALIVLWYMGYHPEHWFRIEEARAATIKRIVTLAVAIGLLSAFLVGVTYDSFRGATQQEAIREDIADILDSPEYRGYALFDVDVDRSRVPGPAGLIFHVTDRVVVTVGVPTDGQPPDLAGRVDDRVDRTAGRDVAVQIRYVRTAEA